MGVGRPRAVEDSRPMARAESSKRVAEGPALLESSLQVRDLVWLPERWQLSVVILVIVIFVLSLLIDFCTCQANSLQG